MKATLILAVVVSLLPATLSAQTSLSLDPGSRVRLFMRDGQEITGRVDGLPGSAIVVMPDGRSTTMSVPLGTIEHVDISRGLRSRKAAAWKKAKWGIVFGGVPGAISLGLQHETVGEHGSSVGHAAALGACSGGVLGGLIGAAIGAAHPGENWERIR
jgi:hypothetical protein